MRPEDERKDAYMTSDTVETADVITADADIASDAPSDDAQCISTAETDAAHTYGAPEQPSDDQAAAPYPERTDTRREKLLIIVSLFLFLASAAIMIVTSLSLPAARAMQRFSKTVSSLISVFTSFIPISVVEWLLYALICWFLYYTVKFIRSVIKSPDKKRVLLRYISTVLIIASVGTYGFTALYRVDYNAPLLADELSLEVRERPPEDLVNTVLILLTGAEYYASCVNRNENGDIDSGGFFEQAKRVPDAYKALAEEYPIYKAPFYARAKWVAAGKIMSYSGISGIYIPFTAEANVDPITPDSHLPFTMCHEAAHRLGIAREDEANFSAFLACISSPETSYKYSGYLVGYIYAVNALNKIAPSAAGMVAGMQSEALSHDISIYSEYIKQYEGPVKEVGEAINNAYLQAMGQYDGTLSYGRVVDLLCAFCAKMSNS